MSDQLAEAVERAAEFGDAPPKVWHVGPNAVVQFARGTGGHPFDEMTITHWTD